MSEIIVDSREKKPYSFFGEDVIRDALETGDYTIKGFECMFAVERKSLDDLANTLGQGRERFERELSRAQEFEEFVVVIEADESALDDVDANGYCTNYYSNIHPNSIRGTVREWPKKYRVLEFEWAGSRAAAKAKTLDLLKKWEREYQ